jgi:glycerophosphoryl diester phosphodiesterase
MAMQRAVAARPGRPERPYFSGQQPMFFAHRGGALLAPENTLVAFERGASYGADALELDIQMTRDGELVVIHDMTVDRTTDGTGPVAAYTLDELRRLDAGYRFTPDGGKTYPFRGQGITIPTLAEVFARFPTLRVNIDLKESDEARERKLWALIQELEVGQRVLVASGEAHLPIVRFRQISGGRVATSASKQEIRTFVLLALARGTWMLRPVYDALQVPEIWKRTRVVSPTMLAAAHRRGLHVHVWTVDDRPSMERLLAWGVDGLMTDRPDLLAEVLAARAQAPA